MAFLFSCRTTWLKISTKVSNLRKLEVKDSRIDAHLFYELSYNKIYIVRTEIFTFPTKPEAINQPSWQERLIQKWWKNASVATIRLTFPKSTLTSSNHPLLNVQHVPGVLLEALETLSFSHLTRRPDRWGMWVSQQQSDLSPKCQNPDFHHLAGYKVHLFPLSHAALPYGCGECKVKRFICLMLWQPISQENENAENKHGRMATHLWSNPRGLPRVANQQYLKPDVR